jgi:hypothetical protein
MKELLIKPIHFFEDLKKALFFFFFLNWAQLLTEYCPNVLAEYTYLQNTKNINVGKLGLFTPGYFFKTVYPAWLNLQGRQPTPPNIPESGERICSGKIFD